MVEVGEKSPPVLFHAGESLRLERLPVGSRIVYAPPPLSGLADPQSAIAAALDNPLGMEPLDALLRPGMRLTIAFDDISLPLPPMRTPDVRQQVIEQVLERAYRAGVDDIHLIAALAVHRRMTPAELRRAVGPRVFDAFYPDRLYNHDAEDPDGIAVLGDTEQGEAVELNKRAAESDLLVYVNINLVTMDGGHKSVPIGLGTYRSLRAHHNVHTMRHSRSFMDPPASELHRSARRQGEIVEAAVPIFHIETTLNNDMFAGPLSFLGKPEGRWSAREQATFAATKRTLDRTPLKARRTLFQRMVAPYALTGVNAGAVDDVHGLTLERCADQQAVMVEGQADVVTAGLPYICPYNVNSIMNPVLVMCLGLGYFFNLYKNAPLVREGGVMIFTHPVEREFHPVHHPVVHRLLRGGARADHRPGGDRGALREAVRRGRVVPPSLPHLLRLPRRPPALHVVLGLARDAAPRRDDLRGRRPGGLSPDGVPARGHDARRARDGRARGGARLLPDPPALPAAVLLRGHVRLSSGGRALERMAGGARHSSGAERLAPLAHARRQRSLGAQRTGARPGLAAPAGRRGGAQRAPAVAPVPARAHDRAPARDRSRRAHERTAARAARPQPRERHRHAADPRRACRTSGAAAPWWAPPPTASTAATALRSSPRSGSTPSRSTAAGDLRGLASAAELLRSGHNVLLYPQATRSSGQIEGFRTGVARLAIATSTPLVPIHVGGSAMIMPKSRGLIQRGRTTVAFGRPIYPLRGRGPARADGPRPVGDRGPHPPPGLGTRKAAALEESAAALHRG